MDDPRVVVLTAGLPQPGWGGSSRLGYHSSSPSFPKEKQAGSAGKGLWSNLLLMAGLVLRSYQVAQGFTQFSTESSQRWAIPFASHYGSEFFPCVSNFNIFSFSCLISKPGTTMRSLNPAQEPFLLVIAFISPGIFFSSGSLCLPYQACAPAPTLLVVFHFNFPMSF